MMLWTAPPPALRCAEKRYLLRQPESLFMATGGNAQIHWFATGVGSKTDIGAPSLTQLSFMSTQPSWAAWRANPGGGLTDP